MKHRGYDEEDFERADLYNDQKVDRIAKQIERSNENMENMNKPTAPPWEAALSLKGQPVVRHPCGTHSWEVVCTCDGPNAAANAALIAEVHNLLEACKALDDAFMPKAQAFDTLAVWAARDKARAAIAKATPDTIGKEQLR